MNYKITVTTLQHGELLDYLCVEIVAQEGEISSAVVRALKVVDENDSAIVSVEKTDESPAKIRTKAEMDAEAKAYWANIEKEARSMALVAGTPVQDERDLEDWITYYLRVKR